ncbi:MAG: hypothetical protein ABFC28_01995 [Rikenellaceae bacterium]
MKNNIIKLLAISSFLLFFGALPLTAQNKNSNQRSEFWDPNKVNFPAYSSQARENLTFPKVLGYEILACDFHTHTMFSDGLVWPTLRVSEAWLGGLDAMALTDHIEYRPFKNYTNNDHNTSFDIAKPAADEVGFMLIKGTEITRTQRTLGHFNALFITDANSIAVEDPKQSVVEARKQNAFIIWNHPGWAVDSTYIKEFQEDLFKDGLIQGIEVYNNSEFYPRVLAWAIDKNLAIIAASDVHGNVESGVLKSEGVLRPMTLVLAKEHSITGIREALDAGRTIALFQNILAAKEEIATGFVDASLSVKKVFSNETTTFYTITNKSSVPFKMFFNKSLRVLPALSTISFSAPKEVSKISVIFENIFIYENQTLAHDLQLN